MQYKIFQLDMSNDETRGYRFMGWEFAAKYFNRNHYKEMYSGEMDEPYILEAIWEKFNLDHPEDFKGHSLSVSDVVALKKPDKDYWYYFYCDSFGWKEVTEYWRYRYGMRLRGFSPGAQPKGVVFREDDPKGKYHDIIYYSAPLTEKEISDYELDDLN